MICLPPQTTRGGEMSNTAITLTDLSPRDKPWDLHKTENSQISSIYKRAKDIRKAERMNDCSGFLDFDELVDKESGEIKLRLSRARFCRVRLCPICQWRRSLYWKARFYQALPNIIADNPQSRFLFLTLTVRNCDVHDLRSTLNTMTKAWGKLVKRKVFSIVQGWVRTTEITRGKDGSAHPHFHILIMVPASYFGQKYIKQSDWVALWQSCLKVNYEPNIDIRTIKSKKKKGEDEPLPVSGLKEVLKYSVKPSDMIQDESWFLEMSKQIAGTRAIALGGYFADILKKEAVEDMPSEEDMIHLGDDEVVETAANVMQFLWRHEQHQYILWGRKKKEKPTQAYLKEDPD